MATPDYDQQTPASGIFIASDNSLNDIQQVLQSGAVVATAVASPDPVVPVGEATIPQIQNLPAWAGKFLNSDNELIDLLEFLTSGAIQVQIAGGGGGAPSTASYITAADETAVLPNSFQLLGTANQIDFTGGVLSLSADLILPGTLKLGGDFFANGNVIKGGTGTSLLFQASTSADFDAPWISANGIRRYTESTNKILFGAGVQQFLPNNNLQLQISASGMNLASGPAVNSITASPTSVSTTALMTAFAIQSAIASAVVGGHSLRGGWDASGGLYPTTGGSGVAGAVAVGDWWYITVAGTLGTNPVDVGDQIFALVDVPGQTDANWLVVISKVDSVFGRVGPVVALANDYNISQITNGLSNALTQNYFFSGNGSNIATGITPQAAINILAGGVASGQYLRGNGSNVVLSAIQAADVPTLNQNTSGQAGSVSSAVTFDNSGSGAASGTTFNGSATRTISYNTVGAAPLLAFNTVSASTQALSANNSYYITYSGICVMPLPATIQAGEYIEVMVDSSGGKFHITQAAGQSIKYGANSGASVTTGSAATGYLESRYPNTSILLKCVVSNTTFMVVNNINDCIVST